ncbi:MAG: porin family protein [Myxococcales bacterium]|nr:porin family protein [Myxococcales bacterium]
MARPHDSHREREQSPLRTRRKMERSSLRLMSIISFVALAMASSPAAAVDLYGKGNVFVSDAEGQSSGQTTFFPLTGSDDDQSPAYGGALGVSFSLEEALTKIDRVPVPRWRVRLELEGTWGRDYEFRTSGGDGFFTEVEADTIIPSIWLEVPVHEPVSWIFGRVPILEPLRLYGGGGVGWADIDIATTDNISSGSDSTSESATQWGAGISYDLTRNVTWSLGYRQVDLGDLEVNLMNGPTSFGTYELELDSSEITTGMEVRFFSFSLPGFGKD